MDPQLVAQVVAQALTQLQQQVDEPAQQAEQGGMPGNAVVLPEIYKKTGWTSHPHHDDFKTYDEALHKWHKEKRTMVEVEGYNRPPAKRESWPKEVFDHHNDSQKAHQATLLEHAHEGMVLQHQLLALRRVLPEELEVADGVPAITLVEEMLTANRHNTAKLRHKSWRLMEKVLQMQNNTYDIADMDEESEKKIDKALKKLKEKKDTAKSKRAAARAAGGKGHYPQKKTYTKNTYTKNTKKNNPGPASEKSGGGQSQ
jgi:hypothetical protein